MKQMFRRAVALHGEGDIDSAEPIYRRIIGDLPDFAATYNNLGSILAQRQNFLGAMECYDKAIDLMPLFSQAHNNRGIVLVNLERRAEALQAFRTAVSLGPFEIDNLTNLGQELIVADRFEEAEEPLRRALMINPKYIHAMVNLGGMLWARQRLDDAAEMYRATIAEHPDCAIAHKNLGLINLQQGNYAEGWKGYEWRWRADNVPLRHARAPLWRGEDMGDKTLLIWGEQGIGDEIMQFSMARDLAKRVKNIVWECDSRLVALFQRSCPTIRVVARFGPEEPNIAAHLPAGSLCQLLRTQASDFPGDLSYLRADGGRAKELRDAIGAAAGDKVVGISWLSRGTRFSAGKSSALEDWMPLLQMPGYRFVDLQYGETEAERDGVVACGVALHHSDNVDLLRDLSGLAALISACDLVVTVSNTTAHMAAALGRPTCVLVPATVSHFWYWGDKDVMTPWYPMATIIRQQMGQSWRAVLAHLAMELADENSAL